MRLWCRLLPALGGSSEQLPLSSSCTACLTHCSVNINCFSCCSCCSGHRDSPCPGLLGVHASAHLPASVYTWSSPSPVQGTHIKDLLLVPFPLLLASSFTPSLVSPSLSPHHQAKSTTPCNVQLGAPANTWQEGAQEHVLKLSVPSLLVGHTAWLPEWEGIEAPPAAFCLCSTVLH